MHAEASVVYAAEVQGIAPSVTCAVAPTYEAVHCRLDALSGELGASDPGPNIRSLRARLRGVIAAIDRAETDIGINAGKKSSAALRKAGRKLKAFATILHSKSAQHSISPTTWAFLDAPLAGLEADIPNLPTTV